MMDIQEKTRRLVDSLPDLPEDMQAKPEENIKKEEYEKLLCDTVTALQKLSAKALRLKEDFRTADAENFYSLVKKFLIDYERSFLKAKNLITVHRFKDNSLPELDPQKIKGESFSCPVALKSLPQGGYLYILPKMQNKRTVEKSKYEAALLQHIILRLQKEYEEKKGRLTPMENPIVIFVHHVDEALAKQFVPDADNLDVKTAIDCMQNYLIANDTLRDISLMQLGAADTIDYTEVFVIPDHMLMIWLEEHEDLWKKTRPRTEQSRSPGSAR